MNITPKNYPEAIDKIGVDNLIPELKEYHRIMTQDFPNMEIFEQNFNEFEDIRADFQEYFNTLEEIYADKLSGKTKRNQINQKTREDLKKNRSKRGTQKKTTDAPTKKGPEKKVRTRTKKVQNYGEEELEYIKFGENYDYKKDKNFAKEKIPFFENISKHEEVVEMMANENLDYMNKFSIFLNYVRHYVGNSKIFGGIYSVNKSDSPVMTKLFDDYSYWLETGETGENPDELKELKRLIKIAERERAKKQEQKAKKTTDVPTKTEKKCRCDEKELEKQKKEAEREKAKKQQQKEKEKKAAEKEKEKHKGKDAPKGTVYKVLPEVQRIKRFMTLCNARNGAKSSEIVALYRALEIDATTQTIRKTSPYAAEITEIANDLLYIINNSTTSTSKLNLSAERREKYEAIIKGKVAYWSVFFGNKILRMIENPNATREQAKKLQSQIDKKKALIQKEPDKNIEAFNFLHTMLNRYAENGTKMSFQQLQLMGAGLNGVGNLGVTDFLSLISNTFGIATVVSKI